MSPGFYLRVARDSANISAFNNGFVAPETCADAWCRLNTKENTMAYKITDKCVACGLCKDACPVEAISEGSPAYIIDPDKCIDCGSCAGECPNEAIIAG